MPVTPDRGRNRYLDLLRAASIVAVVIGHWLASGVVKQHGRYIGVDDLGIIRWSGWVTLLLQVVPVFFLVGGYVNARSWDSHRSDGQAWSDWVRDRVLRLLMPTCGYALFVAIVIALAEQLHGDRRTIQQAGWALALHLWFLAAYLVILLCAPALHAAHRKWGLCVPAVMATVAIVIDTGVVVSGWHIVGWANYLLVWGTFHQLGFSWFDGSLRRPFLLAAASAAVLAGLIWWGPYPVSMVGVPGARIQNASPPSTALLFFGLAQAGLVIAVEPMVAGWLDRHRQLRSVVDRAGPLTMPVYLWHMVPLVIVIQAGYLDVFGQPPIGSGWWWQQRPLWILTLAVVLAGVLAVVAGAARLIARAPGHGSCSARSSVAFSTSTSVALLSFGVVVSTVGVGYLSIHGFARNGRVDSFPLVSLAVGVVLVSLATPRRRQVGADLRS